MKVLLLAILGLAAVGWACDSDELNCANESRCIPLSYVCDSDNDCGDDSDEADDLCEIWRNDCSRGDAKCRYSESRSECVDIFEHCRSEVKECELDIDPRICEMMKNGKLQSLDSIVLPQSLLPGDSLNKSVMLGDEFLVILNQTISHPDCPPMYTLVGDQCLSLFFIGSVSWGEARAFCQVIGGDLISFRNASHYADVIQHFRGSQVTSDFWIGGRLANETIGWSWVDEFPIDLGTPYWALRYKEECMPRNVTFQQLNTTREANRGTCYHYEQAPSANPNGLCVALNYEHFYYMSDEDCLAHKSPLCVHSRVQFGVGFP